MRKKETRLARNETGTHTTTAASSLSERSRVCSQCGRLTTDAEMAPQRMICQTCLAENKSRWYRQNRDQVLPRQARYRAANPGIASAKHYRERARRYGLPVVADLITNEDLISRYGDACYYNSEHPFEVSDHRIPVRAGGPHQLWNVVPCCRDCNAAKKWGSDRVWIQLFDKERARDAGKGPSDAASAT